MGRKEKIFIEDIADYSLAASLRFALNKNISRSILAFHDGLKPVERRFIYSLYTGKGKKNFIKMAKAGADTVADFHPHAPESVYDVGAKLASPIKNNVVCVDGQGNFGSYKSDKVAASRYIEVKLSKYAYYCFFKDFKHTNVPMFKSYTGDVDEPWYLPSRYPHAIINPQISAIGWGSSSYIPPFNFTEVINATIKLMKNPKSKILLVPDSPTGADVIDDGQFPDINNHGIGTFTLRGSIDVNDKANTLTITSIPLQSTIDDIIRTIVDYKDTNLSEIINISDYTKNKSGVRTILTLQNKANPYKTIEKLYNQKIGLEKTYAVNLRMINKLTEIDYSIRSYLLEWIEFRRDTVTAIYNNSYTKTVEDIHVIDTLIFVLNADNAMTTVKLAKKSKTEKEFAVALMKAYSIDSHQANTISKMRMVDLNKDKYEYYLKKREELQKEVKRLEDILDNNDKIDEIIIEELQEGVKLFGRARKSKIISDTIEVDDSDCVIAISKDRYIKKLSDGSDIIGYVGQSNGQYTIINANNASSILIFDSKGIVSKIDTSLIPDMNAKDIGVPLDRYLNTTGEIIGVFNSEKAKKGEKKMIALLTKKGYAKRTLLSEFDNLNGSTNAIKITQDDELVGVEIITEGSNNNIAIIYTNKGNGICRPFTEISLLKAPAKGVVQITLNDDEHCVGIDKMDSSKEFIFYMTTSGRGKITETKYLPESKRKGESLSLINLKASEELICVKSVNNNDVINVIKKKSPPSQIFISDLPISTRVSTGDKIIKTPNGDKVIACMIQK